MVTFTLLAFTGWHYLYSIPLAVISLFLILVILVQRGRGGGLTGALGGMGGQSAFGTKAGDLFTKITIVVAAIWILLSLLAIQRLARPGRWIRTKPARTRAMPKLRPAASRGLPAKRSLLLCRASMTMKPRRPPRAALSQITAATRASNGRSSGCCWESRFCY